MDHPRLDIALRAVADSCRVAHTVQQSMDEVRAITKDDRSPVTVADFAVQAAVAMSLAANDHGTRIVGEERAAVLRQPEQAGVLAAVVDAVRAVHPEIDADGVLAAIDACDHDASAGAYWVLDPVDGTKGFLRGQQYAIALGRVEAGVVTLGIMGCPNLPADSTRSLDEADASGVLYAAERGRGAWAYVGCAPEAPPVRIATKTRGANDPVRMCESVESAHSSHSASSRVMDAIGGPREAVRLDSQCKYAVVARGQADAYLRLPTRADYVERVWDHAAGSLIATEAGAVVTDVEGRPLDFSHGTRLETNRGVVCAGPGLHARLVEAIATLDASGAR